MSDSAPATRRERPMVSLAGMPSSQESGLTKVPNMSRQCAPVRWNKARILGLTTVMQMIALTPSRSCVALMTSTAALALSTLSINGMRTCFRVRPSK